MPIHLKGEKPNLRGHQNDHCDDPRAHADIDGQREQGDAERHDGEKAGEEQLKDIAKNRDDDEEQGRILQER